MADKYDFRILLETVKGKKFSYMTSSFFNSDVNTNYAVSASEVYNRITGSLSCSYVDDYNVNIGAADFFKASEIFKGNKFISASFQGNVNTGSISYVYTGTHKHAIDGHLDRLSRFKFFGSKVCSVLNLVENFWYRPTRFVLDSGSNSNYFSGDVDAPNLNITNNFKIAGGGALSSDLPIIINKETSRWLTFLNVSGSTGGTQLPHADLKIGYDDTTNTYMISASARNNDSTKFVIDGVTSMNVTSLTSSYTTSSVRQIFTEITSSGNSLFGDASTDHHRFNGDISSSGKVWIGKSLAINTSTPSPINGTFISHSVDGLNLMGDMSMSGHIKMDQGSTIMWYSGVTGAPSVGIAKDTNDGMVYGDSTAKYHYWSTVGGVRMFITQSGQVGINTPVAGRIDEQLVVRGNISTSLDPVGRGGSIMTKKVLVGGAAGVGTASVGITVKGDITSSGWISASGDLTANRINLANTKGLRWRNAAGTTQGTQIQLDNNDQLQIGNAIVTKRIHFIDTAGTTVMVITGSRVGIGSSNTSPTEALDVRGNISSSGYISTLSHITASGNISASGTVFADKFVSAGGDDQIEFDDNLYVTGHITGSNISASGNIMVGKNKTLYTPSITATGNTILSNSPHHHQYSLTASKHISSSGILIASQSVIGTSSPVSTFKLTVAGPVSASGQLHLGNHAVLSAAATNTQIHSENDIYFRSGSTNVVVIDGSNKRMMVGSNNFLPPKTLTVEGDISASGDIITKGDFTSSANLFVGNSKGAHLSASNGNLQLSGSGNAKVEITGSLFVTNSGSFDYITASKIDVDDDSIRIGGEAINKTLVQNIKRGHSSTKLSPAGETIMTGDTAISGTITISGSIIPSHDASRFTGHYLGSSGKRFKGIYLASTIDVSGSALYISPSASVAAGEEFNVIVSGSILPANTASNNIGSATKPFHDLYVSTASIKFIQNGSVVDTLDKDTWNNVKQGKFSDVSGTGDIKISGSLLPSVTAVKGRGFSLGSDRLRWSRIYLASTLDVSGSQLVIQPSGSDADIQDFNIIVSGSILPANSNSHSIGSIEQPFKDLYVQSESIYFADMKAHDFGDGNVSWDNMTRQQKLSRSTTFRKKDIDDLKAGRPISEGGHMSASGDMFISGSTKIIGNTEIIGNTILAGSTDVRGGFSINQQSISDAELQALRGLSTGEGSIQTQMNAKAFKTHISGSFVAASSSIATDINSKATTAGVAGDLIPDGDGTRDLGASGREWQDLWIDGTANIDTATIDTTTITNNKVTGLDIKQLAGQISSYDRVHLVDARAGNLFHCTANGDIHGIRGAEITGQIVTFMIRDGRTVVFHHAESGNQPHDLLLMASRDLTVRGPLALQFIFSREDERWMRLI